MSDLFEDLNKFLKKDFLLKFKQLIEEPNPKFYKTFIDLLNQKNLSVKDVIDTLINTKNNQNQNEYSEDIVANKVDLDPEDNYENLFAKLTNIETHLSQMEKLLKEK